MAYRLVSCWLAVSQFAPNAQLSSRFVVRILYPRTHFSAHDRFHFCITPLTSPVAVNITGRFVFSASAARAGQKPCVQERWTREAIVKEFSATAIVKELNATKTGDVTRPVQAQPNVHTLSVSNVTSTSSMTMVEASTRPMLLPPGSVASDEAEGGESAIITC